MDKIFDSSITFVVAIAIPIIAAIIPLIYAEVKERKGNRVLVNLVSVTPQFSISKSVKKDLVVTYKGKPVRNLIAHVFKIGNNGRKVIEPFQLSLIFIPEDEKERIEFIECQTIDLAVDTKADGFAFPSGKLGSAKIWRNFLNPYKIYKEEIIELIVFSNTKLIFSIYGGDKNWVLDSSSRYPRNLDMRIKANRYNTIFWVILGISILFIVIGLSTNNNTLYIMGLPGLILFSIYMFFQSIAIFMDTTNMTKETKIRVNRVEQTSDDTEVLREIDKFINMSDTILGTEYNTQRQAEKPK